MLKQMPCVARSATNAARNVWIPGPGAIIERYRRREASIEESLIEMYLAGVL